MLLDLDSIQARSHIPQYLIPAADSYYNGMVPSLRFNTTMVVIFGIFIIYHTAVGIYTKQWWFMVAFFCAAALEFMGYIGRILSHSDVQNENDFLMQIICLTIAPVFTMGGIYYQLAKIIKIYGRRFSKKIGPMMYSYIFIFSDIASLVIQAVGGGIAGEAVDLNESTAQGDHIFVAGLAVQVASMSVFQFFWYRLVYFMFIKTRIRYAKEKFGAEGEKLAKPLNWFKLIKRIPLRELEPYFDSEYAALRTRSGDRRWALDYFPFALSFAVIFVYVRCIYRVVELAEGWEGYLITHEMYFVFLDGLMMTLCNLVLAVAHPGFAFDGVHTSIKIKSFSFKKNKKNNNDVDEQDYEDGLPNEYDENTDYVNDSNNNNIPNNMNSSSGGEEDEKNYLNTEPVTSLENSKNKQSLKDKMKFW
ncbi:RTA1 domain-containing protein SCDLUD_003168 [Saccharomycodes ludwigii]|uniref:RTA1 domain-containing protein n=1 Tax=Saccharomycodes ludwigii TaxID=36035 RepID=UPI001E83AA17|nr:hypothetical protein SCDLUD_003168 [Saccharomycodes ludwigii]KAH3900197.1 hypothetical protein SCDLUD_003168 [Saccharomycodes ludwigii]